MRERMHWGIFFPAIFILLCSAVPAAFLILLSKTLVGLLKPFAPEPATVIFPSFLLLIFAIPGVVTLLVTWVAYRKSEIVLTNKRLIYRTGLLSRMSGELPLENVEMLTIFESLLGRTFGFGRITEATSGCSWVPGPRR